jgi:hypothetical protein
LPGAIRNLWPVPSPWLIALLFMHTNSIAPSVVHQSFRSLAASMGDGSHLICVDHSRVSLTAVTGEGNLILVVKQRHCPVLQPKNKIWLLAN